MQKFSWDRTDRDTLVLEAAGQADHCKDVLQSSFHRAERNMLRQGRHGRHCQWCSIVVSNAKQPGSVVLLEPLTAMNGCVVE